MPEPPNPSQPTSAEPRESLDLDDVGLLREFWLFLKLNKKWWLAPIALAILLLALLALLSGTGPPPFIYPMN